MRTGEAIWTVALNNTAGNPRLSYVQRQFLIIGQPHHDEEGHTSHLWARSQSLDISPLQPSDLWLNKGG